MNLTLYFTQVFNANLKRYKKKYVSIDSDLLLFIDNLPKSTPTDLGGGVYKYRLSVKSKNKGKSGGFRVITLEVIVAKNQKNITLLTLYDKSEKSSISKQEIAALLKGANL
jgi:hypothetical protein